MSHLIVSCYRRIVVTIIICAILFLPVSSFGQQQQYRYALDVNGASAFHILGNKNSLILESEALTIQRVMSDLPVIFTLEEVDRFQNNFEITRLEVLSYVNRGELLSYDNVNSFNVESSGGIQIFPVNRTMMSYISAPEVSVGSPGSYIAFENVSQIMVDAPIGESVFDIVIPQSAKVLIDGKEPGDLFAFSKIARLHIKSLHSSTPLKVSADRIDVFAWHKLELDSGSFPLESLSVFNGKGTVSIALPDHVSSLNGAGELLIDRAMADTSIVNNGRSNFAILSRGSANLLTLEGVNVLSLPNQVSQGDSIWTTTTVTIVGGIIATVVGGLIVLFITGKLQTGRYASRGFKITEIRLIKNESQGKAIYYVTAQVISKHPMLVKNTGAQFEVTGDGKKVNLVFVSRNKEYGNEKIEISPAESTTNLFGWSDSPDQARAHNGELDEIRMGESKYVVYPHNFSYVGTNSRTHRSNFALDLTSGQKYKVKILISGVDSSGRVIEGKAKTTIQA